MSNHPSTPGNVVRRRPSLRQRVLLGGLVTYGQGTHCFSCVIRDLNETGARISMKPRHALPSNIFLINLRDRVAYDCRTVWSKGSDAGLAIKKVLKLDEIADSKLAFLKRLGKSEATRIFLPTI